ncbi:MAG: hypothetical protein WD361_08610 [Gracilimonas sp.]
MVKQPIWDNAGRAERRQQGFTGFWDIWPGDDHGKLELPGLRCQAGAWQRG